MQIKSELLYFATLYFRIYLNAEGGLEGVF